MAGALPHSPEAVADQLHDPGGAQPGPEFERIVGLAAFAFHVPLVLMTLAGRDRQVSRAQYGLDLPGAQQALSLCAHVVANNALLVVADASVDGRFAKHPLVSGPPGIRFYAGVPLLSGDGQPTGS